MPRIPPNEQSARAITTSLSLSQSNADTSCNAIPPKEGEDQGQGLTEDELKFKRIQAAATPSLHPRRGDCVVREAEPEMLLRRLLRSRSGMT